MRAIDSKGLEEWTQLIESGRLKGPELAEAYFERSNAYPTGNLDGRMADLSKAIEIDPRHHSALFWRGSYHELQKAYDRAVEDYTKAIAIVGEIVAERRQPTLHSWLWARLVSLHRHRGYLYRDAGKYDLAIADATKLIELHADREKHVWPGGDEAGAKREEADETASRADLYIKAGKPDQALADISRALSWIRIGASIGSTSAGTSSRDLAGARKRSQTTDWLCAWLLGLRSIRKS